MNKTLKISIEKQLRYYLFLWCWKTLEYKVPYASVTSRFYFSFFGAGKT